MIDKVMDNKSAEVCYLYMFDSVHYALCYCQVYGGPVELKVIDTVIDLPQVGECNVFAILKVVCLVGG